MNIYEKIQEIRCELQVMNIKKSGKNLFVGYGYFELSDIIPHINNLMKMHKVTSLIKYEKEFATLILINSEKPDESMSFLFPMSEAALKGCHPIQNLGAVTTYLRRYLWMTAMEIVESDLLDASAPIGTSDKPIEKIDDTQLNSLCDILDNEFKPEDKPKFLQYMGLEKLEDMLKSDYPKAMSAIEAKRNQIKKKQVKK